MAADMKLASVPVIIARSPSRARSWRRVGANAPMPPTWMAMEEKFAKPQRANVGNELVQHHAGAEKVANGGRIAPAYPHKPGHRRENPAKDPLERIGSPAETAKRVQPAEQSVAESDQGDESDEHRRDVQRKMQAFGSASRGRVNHVYIELLDMQRNASGRLRLLGFRNQHFGQHDCSGRSHDDRRE